MQLYQVDRNSTSFNIMDDEAVIIHTGTSAYFAMNPSGTYLWNLMVDSYRSTDELVAMFSTKFEQASGSARKDVEAFLDKLIEAELVLVKPGAPGPSTADGDKGSDDSDQNQPASAKGESGSVDPYETPDLVRFGDLETLILSGE